MIPPFDMANGRNWYPYLTSWRKRCGYSKYTAASLGAYKINGLVHHCKASGVRRVVAAATDGNWYDITGGVWTTTAATGLTTLATAKWRWTTAPDESGGVEMLIGVNGVTGVPHYACYSAGGAWTDATLSGTPGTTAAKDITCHRGRVWITGYTENVNGAKYSRVAYPGTWGTTYGGEVTFYTPDDNSGMVGLGECGHYLAFFKRYSVAVLVGENNPDVWYLRELETNNGAVVTHSIVDTSDGAPGVFWLSDEGPMMLDPNLGLRFLGNKIHHSWDGTVWSWDSVTTYTDIHGIWFAPRQEVWWYLPTHALRLVYSVPNDALSLHTDYGYSSCFGYISNLPVALFGSSAGYVYQADSGYTDDGTAITDYLTTPLFDDRDMQQNKFYHSIIPIGHCTSTSGTLSVTGNIFYDGYTAAITNDSLTLGATAGVRYFSEPHPMDTSTTPCKGHAIQLQLASTGNWGTNLYGYIVERETVPE
jgi:hypothetical protein